MKIIKETWGKLPKGVKTGIKIAGAIAVGTVVVVAGNKVYNEYNKKDEEIIDPVLGEGSTVVVLGNDEDEPELVVIPE